MHAFALVSKILQNKNVEKTYEREMTLTPNLSFLKDIKQQISNQITFNLHIGQGSS
jgi:hypothetical protein